MAYKHDYDKILTRLTTILQRLYEGEELRIKELTEEFNVSHKTIQRDLNERLVRFPIEREGNRFKMAQGFRLEKTKALEDELVLDILETISEGIGARFSMKAKQLLSKIKNQGGNPLYVRLELEDISAHSGIVLALENAIRESVEVSFEYDFGAYRYELDVQPLKIISYEGFWYLLGMDARNGIVKKYYLKGIENIKTKEKRFSVPKAIEEKLENAVNVWFESDVEPFRVRLEIRSQVAKYFKRRPINKSQTVESIHEDGTLIVSLSVTSFREVIPSILYWIPYVKVLEPAALNDEIRKLLEEYREYSL